MGKKVLIVVDPQVDFFDGGKLEVPNSLGIIPKINELIKNGMFDLIVVTQDWHPSNHKSFASQHGKNVFEQITLNGIQQVLWPDHCIQNTDGAKIHHDIVFNDSMHIVKKGMNPELDSYSAFYENDGVTGTGLVEYLKEKNVESVYVVGLAYDYCVAYTAIDSSKFFRTYVIKDASQGISENTSNTATENMLNCGIGIINSSQLIK